MAAPYSINTNFMNLKKLLFVKYVCVYINLHYNTFLGSYFLSEPPYRYIGIGSSSYDAMRLVS